MKSNFSLKTSYNELFFILWFLSVLLSIPLPIFSQDSTTTNLSSNQEETADAKYAAAIDHIENGRYWESARELITLIDLNPHYSKSDRTIFTLSDALYELHLLESSAKLYKYIVTKHVTSSLVPQALLGLQRIAYDRGDLQQCIEYHEAIMRGNPTGDLTNISNYYAGLAYYKLKDYPKSVQMLSKVKSASPYYDYTLYTLALAMLRMQKIHAALDQLDRICDLPITNDERRHVVDEAHLTIGYLYYELGYYEEAIEQFNAVSPTSERYQDVLLAQGWAATKLQDWQGAISPLTKLVANYDLNDVTQEGMFLLGRCYLKIGRFDEAINVYDHLVNIFPEKDKVNAMVSTVTSNLDEERDKIEKRKMELLVLETKLVNAFDFGNKNPAGQFNQERQELLQDQTTLLARIQKERQTLESLLTEVDNLKQVTSTKEQRRNWRAYAEYGKSRAMFLKRQQRHQ